ncbi:hypothetical protein RI129_003690 [Pyrocoelia pectoralis]|uniref:Uncharacterized protein n=1 Tax=Pyrocoelia pectoralis TaxID=417401 RepID=A0AAN7VR16_9COLE
MEHYGLYNSPSFVAPLPHDSDSSNSEDDSYRVYKDMQRIPNVALPDSKSKQKRLFTRKTSTKQYKKLHDYLMQLKHPIVASTPLPECDVNTIDGSTISLLSPIRAKRNSIIHINPHQSLDVSNNENNNHSVKWVTEHLKTLKKINRKKKRRKGQTKKTRKLKRKPSVLLVKNTSAEDNLDGIEPLSNESTIVGSPKVQVVDGKETQTSFSSFYKNNVGNNNQNGMSKMINVVNPIDFLKQRLSTSRRIPHTSTNVNQGTQCSRSPFTHDNSACKILTKIDLFSSPNLSTTTINKTNNDNLRSEDKVYNASIINTTNNNNNKENLESGKKIPISDRKLRSQTRAQNTFRVPEIVPEKPKRTRRKINLNNVTGDDSKMREVGACNQTLQSECSEAKAFSMLDVTESIRNSTYINCERRSTRKNSRLLNDNSNRLNNTEEFHNNNKSTIETKHNKTSHTNTLTAIPEDLSDTTINKTESKIKKSGTKRKNRRVNNLTVEVESTNEKTKSSFDEKQEDKSKLVVALEQLKETKLKRLSGNDVADVPPILEPNATDVRHSELAAELEKDFNENEAEYIELSSHEKSRADMDTIIEQEIDNVQEFDVVKDGIQSDMDITENVRELSVFEKRNLKVQTPINTSRRVTSQTIINHRETGNEKSCVEGEEDGNDDCSVKIIKEPSICERSIEVNSKKVSNTPVYESESTNLKKKVETRAMNNSRKRVIDRSLSNYGETGETCSKKSCVEEREGGNNLNGNVQEVKEAETQSKKLSVFECDRSNSDINEIYRFKRFEAKANDMQFSERCNQDEAHFSNTATDLKVKNVHVTRKNTQKRTYNKRLRSNDTDESYTSTCSSKNKTNALSKQNMTNIHCTYSHKSGFVLVDESQQSVNTNNTVSDCGRPKRACRPPVAFIQAAFVNTKPRGKAGSSDSTLKNVTRRTNKREQKSSESTTKNVTKKTRKASTNSRRKIQSINNNTSAIRNMEVITNGADQDILFNSTQTYNHLPATSEHLSQDDHESDGLEAAPLSTSIESPLVQKQDNTKVINGSKVAIHQNLILTKNKTDLVKKNEGESSRGCSKKNNSEEDQSDVFKDTACIPQHQQIQSGERIIQAVIGNKSIPLAWCAEAPQFDTSQNLSVIYCLTNLKNHMCVYSSGYLLFGPGQERSQIPKKHVIAYKVDSGNVSVTQQFTTQTFGVNSIFYIPLGSPYKLKNTSDTEHLILFFSKLSNDSSIN